MHESAVINSVILHESADIKYKKLHESAGIILHEVKESADIIRWHGSCNYTCENKGKLPFCFKMKLWTSGDV